MTPKFLYLKVSLRMDYITLLIGLLIGTVVGYFGNQLIQKTKKRAKRRKRSE